MRVSLRDVEKNSFIHMFIAMGQELVIEGGVDEKRRNSIHHWPDITVSVLSEGIPEDRFFVSTADEQSEFLRNPARDFCERVKPLNEKFGEIFERVVMSGKPVETIFGLTNSPARSLVFYQKITIR